MQMWQQARIWDYVKYDIYQNIVQTSIKTKLWFWTDFDKSVREFLCYSNNHLSKWYMEISSIVLEGTSSLNLQHSKKYLISTRCCCAALIKVIASTAASKMGSAVNMFLQMSINIYTWFKLSIYIFKHF